MNEQETQALLDGTGTAFTARDIDAMARYFAKDGEFVNTIGPPHTKTATWAAMKSKAILAICSP
jgi:hypothetical protein